MRLRNYFIFDRTVEDSFALIKAVEKEISYQMLKISVQIAYQFKMTVRTWPVEWNPVC